MRRSAQTSRTTESVMKVRSKLRTQTQRRAQLVQDVRLTPAYQKMATKVKTEMEVSRKRMEPVLGKSWVFGFLNNFRLFLPGSGAPSTRNKQIMGEVNSIIKQFGLNPTEIAELHTKRILKKNKWDGQHLTHEQYQIMDAASTKQCELALPIYIELRRRGHTHDELCS